MHQNRSHHHHGTAEGSFTAKKWFGHRAGRSPCAHSIGKFFLCYIVLFSSETSAPGSPGNYLYIYIYYTLYDYLVLCKSWWAFMSFFRVAIFHAKCSEQRIAICFAKPWLIEKAFRGFFHSHQSSHKVWLEDLGCLGNWRIFLQFYTFRDFACHPSILLGLAQDSQGILDILKFQVLLKLGNFWLSATSLLGREGLLERAKGILKISKIPKHNRGVSDLFSTPHLEDELPGIVS